MTDYTCDSFDWIVVTDYTTGRSMRIRKSAVVGYIDMIDGQGGEIILTGNHYMGIKELSTAIDRKMGIRVN